MTDAPLPVTQRLDQWLVQARFVKTRSRAVALLEDGAVTVNAQVVKKPAAPLRVGDTLTLRLGATLRRLQVQALATRRGPASEAQTLYAETMPPERLDVPRGDLDLPPVAARAAGSGRPTKRDRRHLDALRSLYGDGPDRLEPDSA